LNSWLDSFLYVAGGILIMCSYALFATTVKLLHLGGYSGLALLGSAIFAWILFVPLGVAAIHVATKDTENDEEGDTR